VNDTRKDGKPDHPGQRKLLPKRLILRQRNRKLQPVRYTMTHSLYCLSTWRSKNGWRDATKTAGRCCFLCATEGVVCSGTESAEGGSCFPGSGLNFFPVVCVRAVARHERTQVADAFDHRCRQRRIHWWFHPLVIERPLFCMKRKKHHLPLAVHVEMCAMFLFRHLSLQVWTFCHLCEWAEKLNQCSYYCHHIMILICAVNNSRKDSKQVVARKQPCLTPLFNSKVGLARFIRAFLWLKPRGVVGWERVGISHTFLHYSNVLDDLDCSFQYLHEADCEN